MNQPARWIGIGESGYSSVKPSKTVSFLKFLQRYPIFLLAFGPPILRAGIVGTDTSQAHFDSWNVFQVGWISLIALRAILRLASARSILIPKQIRSILRLSFILGFLFVVSITYSPGRVISAEYCVLYFLNLICVVEFLVDAYRNPPNWMNCLIQLRLISILLFVLVLVTLIFSPKLVLSVIPGAGIRLLGGMVASVGLISATMAIVSAYCFLNSIESRARSLQFFAVGLIGTVVVQSRGADIALFATLAVLAIGFAKTRRRFAYVLMSGLMASILLLGVVIGTIGGKRVWDTFNRGQDIADVITVSGRTGAWKSVIEYTLAHPEGMGYIAGIRATHRVGADTTMHGLLNRSGGTDNSYIEILGDAGWIALALYLVMLAKVFALGLRFAIRYSPAAFASEASALHALRCALLLFLFYLIEGMEASGFVLPMQGGFYYQNITIAIILGASASILIASRSRYVSLAN
jgi:O-Antigen ligase